MLGSIVYLGIIIMGLYVGRLYQKVNSKLMLLIGLICLGGSLLLFVLSRIYWLAIASRFLTGVFQVFMLVYFPVWIDKFGGDNATLWLTLLQVGVPLGIFAGYGMTALIVR
jgi:predicted MFS family arabinose efflux permease